MKLFSVKQAAEYAGVSGATVREWIRCGRLGGTLYTPGGHRRIPERELRRVLDNAASLKEIMDAERAPADGGWLEKFLETDNITKES